MVGEWANELDTGVFALDLSKSVSFWNRAMERITGHVIARHGPLSCIIDCATAEDLLSDVSPEIELKLRTDQGDRELNLKAKVVPDKGANGESIGVVCLLIASQLQPETNGSSSPEACSPDFCEWANALIFALDLDGNITHWNERMAFLTDCDKEDALQLNFIDSFIASTFQDSVREGLLLHNNNSLYGAGEVENFEMDIIVGDEHRSLLVNTTAQRDVHDGNAVNGVICIAHDVSEVTEHHRAVAATARELRHFVDTASVPIFGFDISGNVNEWNDNIAKVTGVSSDEAFNQSFVESFIAEEQRESVQKALDKALTGRTAGETRFILTTKSGEERHFVGNASTRRDGEDNIVGAVCIAQDITESLQHQREIEVAGMELNTLIDEANAPIFGVDADGDINEWNGVMADTMGYSKLEMFDSNMVDMVVMPEYKDTFREYLESCQHGGIQAAFEVELRSRTNELVYLLVSATARKGGANTSIGVLCMAQDITEATQRDGAIASMSHELHHFIDAAHAPIFGIDCEGNVNEWNSLTASITGYSKDEAFDQPLVDTFIAQRFQQEVQNVFDRALKGKETTRFELEFVSKSGVKRILLVNVTSRHDLDGIIVGAVGVAQDVTDDRKHATELLEHQGLQASQEAKVETERNMTAYFAHELRNPLGAIDCALNAMPDLEEPAKSLVSGMQLCTGFMSSIMNNLLDVRKMEEGKMTLTSVPLSLSAVLDGVHKMLLPSVRAGVDFLTICETESRDWVLGDAHRFQQVMTNMITNAIKYTVSGSITLSISWEKNLVRFECADTGPGIPKKEQQKLFERFVQRGGAPGTGLGLAIAKHLVDLMHGSIRFESDPTIKPGTSCIVLMPLPECESPVEVLDAGDTPIQSAVAVLIIDDVKLNRMMLSRRIKKGIAPNATVREASTGEDALQICGTDMFDVIVVDQYMEEAGGVMVGTDVVYAMRRMRIESVIIGCSGNDMDEQFLEAGADFVWKKPMPSNSKIIMDLRTSMIKKRLPIK